MQMFKHNTPATANAVTLDSPVVKAKVREAYNLGRAEERKRHHGSPALMLIVAMVAMVGAVTLFYAFRQGSFMNGGAAIDTKISQVSSNAVPAIQTAAAKAGAVAQTAGEKLQSQGQAIRQDAASKDSPGN